MDKTVDRLIDQLKAWRETEHAAQQDVDDAEARMVAADMKWQEAKNSLRVVGAKVQAIRDELIVSISDYTEPADNAFNSSEV